MNKRLAVLLVPCLLLFSALAFAACGGGDDTTDSTAAESTSAESTSEPTQDESEIESTIVAALTSEEPSKCTEFLTQNFLDQTAEATGKAAREECEEEAPDQSDDPEEIEVTEIAVDGADATATVGFVGSSLDGQHVEVALVEDEGWKLDELISLVDLDKDALASAFEEALEEAGGEGAEQASCFGDAIRGAEDSVVEELVLEQSQSAAEELASACE